MEREFVEKGLCEQIAALQATVRQHDKERDALEEALQGSREAGSASATSAAGFLCAAQDLRYMRIVRVSACVRTQAHMYTQYTSLYTGWSCQWHGGNWS